MSTATQEFKNENISATITHKPGCNVHMEVTVSPLATKASHQKAIKNVSKEVSIPGFRKGKAPEATIIKNYGKYIEKEWKDILLNTTLHEAIQLSKVYPFNDRSVHKGMIKNISLNDGAKLTYEYETAPSVPSISLESLKIKDVPRTKISKSDVEEMIKAIRLQYAEWADVTDRPAEENDYVDITIDALEDTEYNICKNSRFEVAPKKMGTWMRKLIVGMTPGQSVEGTSEKEPHAHDCDKCESGEHHDHEHDHNFKPTHCRITLNAIKAPTLPAFDDEFAKKFGMENIETLEKRLEDDLNHQADDEQINTLRNLMRNQLLQQYPFEIPKSLIESQLNEDEISLELQEKNVEGAALEAETKKIKNEVSNRLSNDYCLYFLAQKVMQDNKLEVTDDEINQEFMKQMFMQQSQQSIINKDMDPKEVRSRLFAQVMLNKSIDYLIEHAQKKLDQPSSENV